MIGVLYYIYHKHNITPDEFAKKDTFSQYLITLFTEREIEMETEKNKKN